MLGLVPFGLEAAQRLEDGDDFSIALTPELRRDAWVAAPRMVSRKRERSAAAWCDVERGRLGNDTAVRAPAPLQHRVGSQAAVLLADDRCEQEVAAQGDARFADGAHHPQRGD
jgi:hypothetical protein